MQSSETLAAYLTRLGCTDVQAVEVKLGRESFPGATFRQEMQTPEGSQARMAGETTYTREMIYCLSGDKSLPKQARQLRCRVTYVRGDDTREWFIAGYSPDVIPADKREYYPFGHFFLLCPWTLDTKIDSHTKTPYTRTYMEVINA